MQKEQAKLQADAQKTQFQAQQDDKRMMFEASEKQKDREMELEKLRIQESTKIALAQFSAESSAQLETTKHGMSLEKQEKDNSPVVERIDSSSQEITGVLSDLAQAMNALIDVSNRPRVPVKNAQGKVVGARPARDDELQTLQ